MKNKLITALILSAACCTAQAGETELVILDPGLDVFTECDYHPSAHFGPGFLGAFGVTAATTVPQLGIAIIIFDALGWLGVPGIENSNFLMPKCERDDNES